MTDTNSSSENSQKDVLVVASKLKKFIKDQAGMNTAGNVVEILSDRIRDLCKEAIEKAKNDGRKTLKDRDFQQTA